MVHNHKPDLESVCLNSFTRLILEGNSTIQPIIYSQFTSEIDKVRNNTSFDKALIVETTSIISRQSNNTKNNFRVAKEFFLGVIFFQSF